MRDNLFKFLFLIGVPRFLRIEKNNTLTVLSLHRISPIRDYFFDPIDPLLFEKILIYLMKYYEIITFQKLLEKDYNLNKPLLILSFDDGYFDFLEYAMPILKKHNISANHNIVNECASLNLTIWTQRLNNIFNFAMRNNLPLEIKINENLYNLSLFNQNWQLFNLRVFKIMMEIKKTERLEILSYLENTFSISSNERMMNWEEINDCIKNNIEIGSHTYSHDVISTIDEIENLEKEILFSKNEIEYKINKPIYILALPNGKGNEISQNIIKKAGFKFLLHVNDNINSRSSYSDLTYNLNNIDRVNLVNESYFETIARIEMFHKKIRKS